MSCIYIYNGHTFNSELELDDFLLANGKLVSKYGDIVFQRSSIHNHVIDILNKAGADSQALRDTYNKVKSASYVDGEISPDFKPPFIGVNRFLSGLRNSEGQLLFPEFREDAYWENRFSNWKQGNFTEDEIEIIFNNDSTKIKTIAGEEANFFRKQIEERWKQQATIGTEIHKILQLYFSEVQTGKNKGKLVGDLQDDFLLNVYYPKKLDMSLVTQKALKDTLQLARQLHKQLLSRFGNDCSFHPEFTISGKIAQEIEGKGDTILGMIDLLVIDNKGNAHIIDYKTSPKSYSKFSDAKKLTFSYQLAVYNRLLEKYGINTGDSEILVMPLQITNFRYEDNTYKYDGVSAISQETINNDGKTVPATLLVSLKNRIENSWPIQRNLDEFIPSPIPDDPGIEELNKNVQEGMAQWFQDFNSSARVYTYEEVKQKLDQDKALTPKDGIYQIRLGRKYITANSEKDLIEKVMILKNSWANYKVRTTKSIISALKYGIEHNTSNINLPKIASNSEAINSNWLQLQLAKYCNGNYKVLECQATTELGCILVQNQVTGQIDVIKISSNFLHSIKHFGGKDRNGLSQLFEPDLAQQSKSNSLMLQSAVGNIECIETMLILNNLNSIYNKNTAIGDIRVINPFEGIEVNPSNEELLYCFNTLNKFKPIKTNKYASKEINLISRYQKFANLFKDIMTLGLNRSWANEYRQFQNFQTCLSMLDQTLDNSKESKLILLDKLRKEMEETFNFEKISRDQSDIASPQRRLYNSVLMAQAELRGVVFRQQLSDADNWIKSFNIFKNGISGIRVDNPGNLDNETLNLITNMTTEAYQNIRQDLQGPIAKIRKLINNLKEEKGYSYLDSATLGNPVKLFEKMIYRDSNTGDLMLTYINDPKLSKAEKEFLDYFLYKVNRNRMSPSITDEQLEKLKQNNDLNYYRLPLAIGTTESKVAVDGLLKAIKDKLYVFAHPKEALQRMRDTLEGINQREEEKRINEEELFQIGTIFDTGERESVRLDYINTKGEGYFEHNLETLLLKHIFSYSTRDNINKVFPMMKAAMAHLTMESFKSNADYSKSISYIQDYIKNKIKNESIMSDVEDNANTIIGRIKSAASFLTLALNPVQGGYQTLQGLWNDIRLIIQKPDIIQKHGKSAFTFKNMKEAFLGTYKDLFVFGDTPTINSLINELYALNDMDMPQYVKRLRSNRGGVWNFFSNFCYKMSSRPDYYNRITIFGAQMRADGSWQAHKVVDGKLVYNWKEDARFSDFANGKTSSPKYNEQRALWYAMAQQFVNEHAKNPDGTDFILNPNKPSLPRAYTNLQAESYKSLADDIYGYYSHDKKSLMHSTLLGNMFLQFKTFWTGKKNQYFGKGGVKLRGSWVPVIENGEQYYYQIDKDGNILYSEPPLSETEMKKQGIPLIAPVMQWKGQWQEGIMLTLSKIFGDYPTNWIQNATNIWNAEDPMLRNVYRSNIKQFLYDITLWMIIGPLIAAILGDLLKDLKEDTKDSNNLTDAATMAFANIAIMSVKNSFLDFNLFGSLVDPVVSWTPMSLDWAGRTTNNLINLISGDKDLWDTIVSSSSALRSIKPGLDIIKPEEYE